MIRHCVFLKFKADITDADKQAIYSRLNGLRDVISGISDASFGPNISPEGRTQGYDDGFTMDFDDLAVRDAYLENPDHRAVGQQLVSLLEGGRAGLLVFDMEV
ncbi:MAG: Dabb family protein [Rhodospirillales bacterium]|nr:Dabb family protein [Rhodospirillales bacterium]